MLDDDAKIVGHLCFNDHFRPGRNWIDLNLALGIVLKSCVHHAEQLDARIAEIPNQPNARLCRRFRLFGIGYCIVMSNIVESWEGQQATLNMAKKMFTPEEIAETLGVNRETIYRHLRAGKLPATKPGGSYIITRADLVKYLGGKERVDSLFGDASQ